MTLIENVRKQMMTAMKEKDTARKEVLSSLLSALKNAAIKKREDLTEEEEFAVVSRELKQIKESLETAPADRVELIEECKATIAVLNEFMPEMMGEDEIRTVIQSVLDKLNLPSPTAKEKGIIMRDLMPLVKGKADGKLVNEILSTYFA